MVIGRNEGERLWRCLESIEALRATTVYVDSGSSDDSVAGAERRGFAAVRLDDSAPFTAARARNAGFAALLARDPGTEFVQFVDGDCEVVAGWLEAAAAALVADPTLGVVCGRRRERERSASIYNRLCDLEWDTPVGLAESCGGDAMMRARVFQEVGGFDPSLIAGGDPISAPGFPPPRLPRAAARCRDDLARCGDAAVLAVVAALAARRPRCRRAWLGLATAPRTAARPRVGEAVSCGEP